MCLFGGMTRKVGENPQLDLLEKRYSTVCEEREKKENKKFLKVLKKLNDCVLDLNGKGLRDFDTVMIIDSLRDDNFIEDLLLRGNKLTEEVATSIVELLRRNRTIRSIDITGNQFSNESLQSLLVVFKNSNSLVALVVDVPKKKMTPVVTDIQEETARRRREGLPFVEEESVEEEEETKDEEVEDKGEVEEEEVSVEIEEDKETEKHVTIVLPVDEVRESSSVSKEEEEPVCDEVVEEFRSENDNIEEEEVEEEEKEHEESNQVVIFLDREVEGVDVKEMEEFDGIGIDLSSKRILDISSLRFLVPLVYLDLSRNKISVMENFPPSLKYIDLSYNSIERITGLSLVGDLEVLKISHNSLSHINGLTTNVNIRELDLSYNRISQVMNVEHLRGLGKLDLSHNSINHLKSVRSLSINTAMRVLTLVGNPVCSIRGYKHFVINLLSRVAEFDGQKLYKSADKSHVRELARMRKSPVRQGSYRQLPEKQIVQGERRSVSAQRGRLSPRQYGGRLRRQHAAAYVKLAEQMGVYVAPPSKPSDKEQKPLPIVLQEDIGEKRIPEKKQKPKQEEKRMKRPVREDLDEIPPEIEEASRRPLPVRRHANPRSKSPDDVSHNKSISSREYEAEISRLKDMVDNLNDKFGKLYNWHLVEIDLVAKQQMQLNHVSDDLQVTKGQVSKTLSDIRESKLEVQEREEMEKRLLNSFNELELMKDEIRSAMLQLSPQAPSKDESSDDIEEDDDVIGTPTVRISIGDMTQPNIETPTSQDDIDGYDEDEMEEEDVEEEKTSEERKEGSGLTLVESREDDGLIFLGMLVDESGHINGKAVHECEELLRNELQTSQMALKNVLQLTEESKFDLDGLLDYKNLLVECTLFHKYVLPEEMIGEVDDVGPDVKRSLTTISQLVSNLNETREVMTRLLQTVESEGLYAAEVQELRKHADFFVPSEE